MGALPILQLWDLKEKKSPIGRNPVTTTTSLPKQRMSVQSQMGSKYVSKEYENAKGIDKKDMTASQKKSITGYQVKSDEPQNIRAFRKRRQCPRAVMQIELLFWIIVGVLYWANQEAVKVSATTKISDIIIAANKEYGPIEMVIKEKDEYLEDEEYKIWHIGYHYSTKDELNLNKVMKIALDASSITSSLKYSSLSKKDETGQTKEKKKENSERISQSFGFELSSTMDAEQSSRAALICVIMIYE